MVCSGHLNSCETTFNPGPFNDVGEGFILSLRTRFYCAEIVKRLLNALPRGDKPLPYVSCNVIDYFELCAHWAESRTLSYETTFQKLELVLSWATLQNVGWVEPTPGFVGFRCTQPNLHFAGVIAKCETQQRPISEPSPKSFYFD